jgi:hypothetical protein
MRRRLRQRLAQPLLIEGLDQIVNDPEVNGRPHGLRGRGGGHGDRLDGRAAGPQAAQQSDAVLVGQAEVEQQLTLGVPMTVPSAIRGRETIAR